MVANRSNILRSDYAIKIFKICLLMVHFLGRRCHLQRCRPLTWCFRYFWCLMVSHFSQGLFYFQSHSDDGEKANPCASRSRCWGRDPVAIRNCCWSCMWDWCGILEWGIEELKCSNDFKPLFVAHWTSFNQQQVATEYKPGLNIVWFLGLVEVLG